VSITGNGNDQVKVGNGTGGYVSIMGNGNENVQTGNGTGQLKIRGRKGVRNRKRFFFRQCARNRFLTPYLPRPTL